MAELIYGFDPLCGWCYAGIPAIRRVVADHPDLPVRLVMSGLAAGDGVRPYVEIEPMIRGSEARLRAVTGRGHPEAFYDLIRRPGLLLDSGPPSVAIAHVKARAPGQALGFAHAAMEAHGQGGADLNDAATYAPLLAAVGLPPDLPDLHDPGLQAEAWAEGRAMGIRSFPTIAVLIGREAKVLPSEYDPARLSALVGAAARG